MRLPSLFPHALGDFVGNLVVFLRYDEELHRLSRTVDDIVAHIGGNQGECHTIYNRLGALEQEI